MTTGEIWDDGFIRWAIDAAKIYENKFPEIFLERGKHFMKMFLNHPQFRSMCSISVTSFKKRGLFNQITKDFSEYANKYEHSKLLNDILKIIWAIGRPVGSTG